MVRRLLQSLTRLPAYAAASEAQHHCSAPAASGHLARLPQASSPVCTCSTAACSAPALSDRAPTRQCGFSSAATPSANASSSAARPTGSGTSTTGEAPGSSNPSAATAANDSATASESALPQRSTYHMLHLPSRTRLLAFYSDHHQVPLPPGHRFPMGKYAATREALKGDASLTAALQLEEAPLATEAELGRAHDPAFVQRFLGGAMSDREMRDIGLPWSQALVRYCRGSAGGGLAATRAALDHGLPMAASIAGGTHHAFRHRGEGFCIFNDIAVGAAAGLAEYGLQRVLVIDLDVHQGNGTAAIFKDEPRVTTFDMHGERNYPWETRQKNTYDVGLPDETCDEAYLFTLADWLPRLFAQHRPQLVFFQAGVDALQDDSFGRLSLTRRGLIQRNNLVYSAALGAGVPLVVVMGGGYSRPMDTSVAAHADVFRAAAYRLAAAGS